MYINKLFKLKNSDARVQLQHQYGGIIKQLNLEEFWASISEGERAIIRNSCKRSFGQSDFDLMDVDTQESILRTRRNTSSFLIGCAAWAIEIAKYDFAEKLLLTSIEYAPDILTLHSSYNWLIKIHDHLRLTNKSSLDDCITYCVHDIDILPLLIEELRKCKRNIPQIRSIAVLLSIYKELGLQDEINKLNEVVRFYPLMPDTIYPLYPRTPLP
ncbi:hypothetical protein PY093_17900 [Cytobacillus sp. S13-E01]|uniref:hypothetical protein n=1 Tax=Cytobacillus sp. S13-E01 TaxID=3031326 RepID=UPI0023D8475B|nr:hypothetical protein [Cytobacillus sp. S13-E01]MDF0728512.1 hypothetical protein [Cytobacillus sp. S13-E01]